MEVKIADSFFDSLKRMINREKWYWKVWDFLRYDLPHFLKNIWLFRKALWNYRWWAGDHAVIPFMREAVDDISKKKKTRGYEVESTSDKKIAMMRRAVYLMDRMIKEDFLELAEAELGELYDEPFEFKPSPDGSGYIKKDFLDEKERAHNKSVYGRAREIEKEMWNELWAIVKGQDESEFDKVERSGDYEEDWKKWEEIYDGSGLNGWWD